MVNRQTRVKKKRFRKTPGGKTVTHYSRKKKSRAKSMLSGKKLSGTGNQSKSSVRKKGKTTRRPTAKFAGMLNGSERKELWEHYALVVAKKKDIEEVPTKIKKLLKTSIKGGN